VPPWNKQGAGETRVTERTIEIPWCPAFGILRRVTSLPLAVGFGVTTPDHVRLLAAAGADGVVVGSAIVKFATEDATPAAVEKFVASLASVLRA
jgi:tryptophan synthase alpha subunit